MRRVSILVGTVAVALAATLALANLRSGAASPGSGAITVPADGSSPAQVTWQGTIPAASVHGTSDCNGAGSAVDQFNVTITPPPGGYTTVTATYTFSITWTPDQLGETAHDEVLTVDAPGGADPADTA